VGTPGEKKETWKAEQDKLGRFWGKRKEKEKTRQTIAFIPPACGLVQKKGHRISPFSFSRPYR